MKDRCNKAKIMKIIAEFKDNGTNLRNISCPHCGHQHINTITEKNMCKMCSGLFTVLTYTDEYGVPKFSTYNWQNMDKLYSG